jgi:hypothetical protein
MGAERRGLKLNRASHMDFLVRICRPGLHEFTSAVLNVCILFIRSLFLMITRKRGEQIKAEWNVFAIPYSLGDAFCVGIIDVNSGLHLSGVERERKCQKWKGILRGEAVDMPHH